MGTTYHLRVETSPEHQGALRKAWAYITEQDGDAPDHLPWRRDGSRAHCEAWWYKAMFEPVDLARIFSRYGASGRLSLARWDEGRDWSETNGWAFDRKPEPSWIPFTRVERGADS